MYAFFDAPALEKVHLPSTLQGIGNGAFAKTPNLKEINLSPEVGLGDLVFDGSGFDPEA